LKIDLLKTIHLRPAAADYCHRLLRARQQRLRALNLNDEIDAILDSWREAFAFLAFLYAQACKSLPDLAETGGQANDSDR
jgi:hypothetical protein